MMMQLARSQRRSQRRKRSQRMTQGGEEYEYEYEYEEESYSEDVEDEEEEEEERKAKYRRDYLDEVEKAKEQVEALLGLGGLGGLGELEEGEGGEEVDMDLAGSGGQRVGDEEGGEGEVAGIVERVEMVEFMNMSHFVVDLGPRVNFIVGGNGTGKSTIVAAITVALGGSASETGRGGRLSELIARGSNSARVTVVLANRGPQAFRPHLFGSSITVRKTLRRDGASKLALLTAPEMGGKPVPRPGAVLAAIRSDLSIQVSNPCCILSQNTAAGFFASTRGSKLMEHFKTASGLGEFEDHIRATRQAVDKAGSMLHLKRREVETMLLARDQAKIELRSAKDQLAFTREIKVLKAELAVATTKEFAAGMRDRQVQIDAKKSIIAALMEKDGQKGATLNRIQDQLVEVRAKRNALLASIAENEHGVEEEIRQRERDLAIASEAAQAATAAVRRAEKMVESFETRLKAVEAEARAKAEAREATPPLGPSQGDAAREAQEARAGQTLRLDALRGMYENKRGARIQAVKELEGLDEELEAAKEEFRTLGRELRSAQRDVESAVADVEAAESARAQRVLNVVPGRERRALQTLLTLVERNVGAFSTPPLGPIGSCLTLTRSTWSPPVMALMGGLASGFLVSCENDETLLMDLISRSGFKRKPQVVTAPRTEEVYDIPPSHRPTELTMLDVIAGPGVDNDPWLVNTLVDVRGIQNQVLFETRGDARTFMDGEDAPPRVAAAWTQDGTKVQNKNGSVGMFPVWGGLTTFHTLLSSEEDARSTVLARVEAGETAVAELGRKQAAVENALGNLEVERENKERIVDRLRGEVDTLEGRMAALEQEIAEGGRGDNDDDDDDAEAEEEALLELEVEIGQVKSDLENAKSKVGAAKKGVASAGKELREKEAMLAEVTARAGACGEKVVSLRREAEGAEDFERKLMGRLETVAGKRERYRERKEKAADELAVLEGRMRRDGVEMEVLDGIASRELRELENELGELRGDEMRASARRSEEVEDALRRVKERIRVFEEGRVGAGLKSLDELQAWHNRLKKQADATKHALLLSECDHQVVQEQLCAREAKLGEVWNATVDRFHRVFESMLELAGLDGDAEIGSGRTSLMLRVGHAGGGGEEWEGRRPVSDLSGGERSMVMVSFLMALWDVSTTPFALVDEADVFMDVESRKLAFERIVAMVGAKPGFQAVFLVPDASSVPRGGEAEELCRVLQLPANVRASERASERASA